MLIYSEYEPIVFSGNAANIVGLSIFYCKLIQQVKSFT